MPHQQCTVCLHADRPAIEAALESGASVRAVARQFGLKHAAIDRHRHHDRNARTRMNIGSLEKIDAAIKKLRQAETNARKRKDSSMALQIAKELRSWFTLRVKAEAISGPREVQQAEQISRPEAVAMARSIIEAEATSGSTETIEWLRGLLERVQGANKRDERAAEPIQPE
jgi:hypothetical protein